MKGSSAHGGGQEYNNLMSFQHYANILHNREIFFEEPKEKIFLQSTCRSDSRIICLNEATGFSLGWKDS